MTIVHPRRQTGAPAESDPEGIAAFVRAELPTGRFGTARKMGDVVCFLASARASWVTGSAVVVDGGPSRAF